MQNEYVVCECTPVVDTLLQCSPVRLPEGELDAVYLGRSGAFAVLGEESEIVPSAVRLFLRNCLGTARIEVYHRRRGLYSFSDNTYSGLLSDEDLDQAILDHAANGFTSVWTEEGLTMAADKLRREDARSRGLYRDSEGNWFVARHGNFLPLSPKDSNHVFRLLLFGGIFGLHRFAVGKWFTGILYFLTAGLFGLGWFMDLAQFCLGAAKDKKKRALKKPDPLPIPVYLAGFATNAVLFCLYGIATGIVSAIV